RCAPRPPRGRDPVGAALGEPAACCGSGLEMFRMPKAATVLVIGGGLMGLLSLPFAKARGAARTILSDPLASGRETARRLGADLVVDPTAEDLDAVIRDATGRRGVHVACEAVGEPDLPGQAAGLLRPRRIVQHL